MNPPPPLLRKFTIGMAVLLVVCLVWSIGFKFTSTNNWRKTKFSVKPLELIRQGVQQTAPCDESEVSPRMVESKLKPGLTALATRIVEKAITDAPPNAVFELRYSRDRGRLRIKGGLTLVKLRED